MKCKPAKAARLLTNNHKVGCTQILVSKTRHKSSQIDVFGAFQVQHGQTLLSCSSQVPPTHSRSGGEPVHFLFMIFYSYRAINIFVFEFTDISSLKSAKVHRRDASFLKLWKYSKCERPNISETILNFYSSFENPACLVCKRTRQEIKQICSFEFDPTLIPSARGRGILSFSANSSQSHEHLIFQFVSYFLKGEVNKKGALRTLYPIVIYCIAWHGMVCHRFELQWYWSWVTGVTPMLGRVKIWKSGWAWVNLALKKLACVRANNYHW